MPVEVFVFFKVGVPVRRKHFAVCIYVYPFALRLLQKLIEIFQVMARHQDRLAFLRAERHLCGYGVTVGPSICRVEEFHRP